MVINAIYRSDIDIYRLIYNIDRLFWESKGSLLQWGNPFGMVGSKSETSPQQVREQVRKQVSRTGEFVSRQKVVFVVCLFLLFLG